MEQYENVKNRALIDSIKRLLDAFHELSDLSNQDKTVLSGLRYLLGQSVRQYVIPSENHHVSKAALDQWKCLSKDKIENYRYRDMVKCDNLNKPKCFRLFKGANNKGAYRKLSPNESFIFRDMYHEDHVIPVSLILNELISAEKINIEMIKNTLDKMHMCVILKIEDRKIGRTRERTLDFEKNKKDVYEANEIEIIDIIS